MPPGQLDKCTRMCCDRAEGGGRTCGYRGRTSPPAWIPEGSRTRLIRSDAKGRGHIGAHGLDIILTRASLPLPTIFTRLQGAGKVCVGNLRRWGITDGWLTTTRAIIANIRPSPFRPACWWSTAIPPPPAGTAASPRSATARRDPPGSCPGTFLLSAPARQASLESVGPTLAGGASFGS
jgi:hypothetical protein